MLKVATIIPHEPYREYKDVERVYSGSTEIDKILDKNGNVLFAVNKEVEGTPALAYKGKEETNLKNYRIYGNTVGGESVGDRTENLFGRELTNNTHLDNTTGLPAEIAGRVAITTPIPINTDTYCLNFTSGSSISVSDLRFMYSVFNGSTLIRRVAGKQTGETIDASSGDLLYIAFYGANKPIITSSDISNIMLNLGSTPLSYEPYGYKVPVTVEGKNLFDNSKTANILKCYVSVSNLVSNVNTKTIFIECKPSTTYTVSKIRGERFVVGWSDKLPAPGVELQEKVINYNASSITITTGLTAKYLVAYIYNAEQDAPITADEMIASVQIEKGSTATPYEPYHAPVTTLIYLPEPIKMVGDEAEYVDYKEQKQHRVRKNLWSGVVEQGRVSNVGAYSQGADRIRSRNVPIEPGTYTISSNLLIRAIYAYNEDKKIGVCTGTPLGTYSTPFTVPVGANNISIGMMKVVGGVEVNVTPSDFIWGQIEKGSEVTTYEPYIENTDLDVTLPALPTLSGTNTLTVGTEVQPSNVYLKGRIKEIA